MTVTAWTVLVVSLQQAWLSRRLRVLAVPTALYALLAVVRLGTTRQAMGSWAWLGRADGTVIAAFLGAAAVAAILVLAAGRIEPLDVGSASGVARS